MSRNQFPRTLNEAFGPYASSEFEEFPMPGPTRGEWMLVLAAIAAILGTIVTVAWVFLG